MRKILLSTSAMLGLAFAITTTNPSVAKDQPPEIKVTGKTSVVSMYIKENNGNKDHTLMRVENAKLNFNAKGSTEALGGIDYSLLIGLSGEKNQQKTAKETKIKIENPNYGSLILGSTKGPDGSKKLGASRIMGATGNFGQYIKDIVNLKEALWTTNLEGSPKGAVKLVYFSPVIEGFQLGLSYTPNTQQEGSEAPKIKSTKIFDKNNIVGQVSYENSFDNGTSIGISVTGIYGQTQSPKGSSEYRNTGSWAIGGTLGYSGFEIGAEFINNNKSRIHKNNEVKDSGEIIDVGISYNFGSHKIAAGYYFSAKENGKENVDNAAKDTYSIPHTALGKARLFIYSLTYDLKIAPGIGVFAEANYYSYETEKDVDKVQPAKKMNDFKNNGNSILIGTKISF